MDQQHIRSPNPAKQRPGSKQSRQIQEYYQSYAPQSAQSSHSRDPSPYRGPGDISPSLQEEMSNVASLKAENSKLKKQLKQTQAKRIQITKQCSQLANKYDKLEEENQALHRRIKEAKELTESEKFQYQQLKFLNKELNSEIEQLQQENRQLSDKMKYQADTLEVKYEQLQSRTFKNIENCIKRIKKSIQYMTSLSAKDFERTKEIQIENLRKSIEILKGKLSEGQDYDEEIEELMNPIRNIQDDLHQKNKDIGMLKQENKRLINEIKKHKKIQKDLLPQYKEAIEKLKKNLGQLRMQLSENEYQKCQIKKKYEERIKQMEIKNEEMFKENRKLRLENKIFEKKLEEMEEDVEEEKERLMGENELLKRLYRSEDEKSRRDYQVDLNLQQYAVDGEQQRGNRVRASQFQQNERQNRTEAYSYKTTTNNFKKARQHAEHDKSKKQLSRQKQSGRELKKNYSASQLRVSRDREHKEAIEAHRRRQQERKQLRIYEEGSSVRQGQPVAPQNEDYSVQESNPDYIAYDEPSVASVSQDGLKNEILKIDQEIMEIQKTLDRELHMYK